MLQNRAFGASLRVKEEDGGLSLDLTVENDAVSACMLSAGSRHEVVKLHNKIGGTLK